MYSSYITPYQVKNLLHDQHVNPQMAISNIITKFMCLNYIQQQLVLYALAHIYHDDTCGRNIFTI